ncbi:MAG: hypothetical protein AAF787_24265 [Chloroflexota bacterium]
MSKNRRYSNDAQILGMVMVGMADAINLTVNDIGEVMKKYGFDNIDPEAWYSVNDLVDFFDELDGLPSGMFDLAAVGKFIANDLQLPDHITTMEAYLNFSVSLYDQVHRGGDVGRLGYKRSGKTHIVEADVPYPPNYMYGLYFGLAQRFIDGGFNIQHDVQPDKQILRIIED